MDRKAAFAALIAHGWRDDLLPVIPPGAKIVEGSSITPEQRGKAPGKRFADGSYGGIIGWETLHASEYDCRLWGEWDCNIGLQIRAIRPVDIDCDNIEIVAGLRRVLELRYGPSPWRGRPNTPRGLALLRAEASPGGKVRLAFTDQHGVPGRIEILGYGNQAVIWGTHPTGVDYEWENSNPFRVAVDTLPALPEADIPLLLEAFAAALEGFDCKVGKLSRHGNIIVERGFKRPLGDPTLLARDFDQAGRALRQIENKFENYDDVIPIIAAFVGAVGGNQEAINAYLVPWLEEWEANPPEWIEKKINSFKDGTVVGADQLFRCARSWGWLEVPTGEFTTVPPEPAPVIDLARARDKAERRNQEQQQQIADALAFIANPYSDQQLALRVWEEVGWLALRMHPSGQWLRWRNGRWNASDIQAYDLVQDCLRHITKRLDEGTKGFQLAFRLESSDRPDHVLKCLRVRALQREWDHNPDLFNTPLSLVNLRTGDKRQAEYSDYIRACAPATPSSDFPERYFDALFQIFEGDVLQIQAWVDWMALGLCGNKYIDKTVLILEGTGRNGKSLLLDVVAAMLGDVAAGGYCFKVAKPDAFDRKRKSRPSHNESLASMDGARMVLFTEMPTNFSPDEELLKAAVAGEIVEAQKLWEKKFEFPFTATITFATNVPVKFIDSPAMRARVNMLHLKRQFIDNVKFHDLIVAEAPKVLNFCMARATEILQGAETFWIRDSWKSGSEQIFQRLRNWSGELFIVSDPVPGIVRCLVERKAGEWMLSKDLIDRVRWGLERVRELYAEDAPELDKALESSERSLGMKIAHAVRQDYARRPEQHGVQRLKAYPGLAFIDKPQLPFS